MIIDNCRINCETEISEEEARSYFNMMKSPEKRLVELDIKIKDDDVLLTPHYDTVIRVRRITGYLSNVKNFNNAKKMKRLICLCTLLILSLFLYG